ncbi:unnamed protein product [Miscanthus lutarioriparius]|uniref:Uncharacterized protein n=1 Tax=Miscanthus lutarioriparius TaxID=422564 RepID=A0A811NWW6_9POAL|nr:unnamed protein product [Miscanthus lutarioriparius]
MAPGRGRKPSGTRVEAAGCPCGSAGLRLAPTTAGGVAYRTAPAWQRAAEASREQPIPAWEEEQHPQGWPMGRGAASPPCGDMELMGRSGISVFRLLGFTEAYNLIKFQPSNYSQMIFTEASITEYEHSRNEEIMKNNRELERLGIKILVPIVNNTSVKRKGEDHKVSRLLYTGQESGQGSEDCEDEELISKVANVAHTKNPTRSGNTSVRGTKASKRVVAPQEQDVPNRVTRQKTRDLALVSSPDPQQVINLGLPNTTPTHDVLVSGSDPSLQQDLVDITDEGKDEKYKDVEPTAFDLFKDFHCSKNKGFNEPIKKAIVDMETIMAELVQDEEQPKSVNHVVSQVVKSTTFLQVAGIQPNSNNSSKGGTSSKISASSRHRPDLCLLNIYT